MNLKVLHFTYTTTQMTLALKKKKEKERKDKISGRKKRNINDSECTPTI